MRSWVRRQAWTVAGAAVLLMASGPAGAAHLRGQILKVGMMANARQGFSAAGDYYRPGYHVPVLVELTNDDDDQFEGSISVRQPDGDGDIVTATREVAVRGRRTFYLYVPGGPPNFGGLVAGMGGEGSASFTVRVLDKDGALAKLYSDSNEPIAQLTPPREIMPASADALMILDISQRPVTYLEKLVSTERLSRETIIGRATPAEVPDTCSGLEMMHWVVWDEADPSALEPAQTRALLEWVRRGGSLLVGVSRNWNLLASSPFGECLPARLTGTAVTEDAGFLKGVISLQPDDIATGPLAPLKPALTYCPVTLQSLMQDARPMLPREPAADQPLFLIQRRCGRGVIKLVPASLQTLLSLEKQQGRFLRDVFQIKFASGPEQGQQAWMRSYGTVDLFERVAAQIAFRAASGFYFAFAFAFVIAYIVIATAVSWGWLRHRQAIRHAWVAFALVALAASGTSLAAVQLVRMIGQGVHEMTIVDGQAGEFDATALSYLGLKTAAHTVVDLCVPAAWLKPADVENRGSLRPQLPETDWNEQSIYSAPAHYESVAPLGELRSVPIRATLKQFEADWRGEMTGRLLASLKRGSRPGVLDASGWIENQLGVSLDDSYLLLRVPQSPRVVVYPCGELPDKARLSVGTLLKELEERQKKKRAGLLQALSPDENRDAPWAPESLFAAQGQCLDLLRVPNNRDVQEKRREQDIISDEAEYVPSLFLLSTYDLMTPSLLAGGQSVQRSNGYRLDCSRLLTNETALFLGFSTEAGPLRLCRRSPGANVEAWRALNPSQSVVMYRFTVPVK